jgi:hypothetical protein
MGRRTGGWWIAGATALALAAGGCGGGGKTKTVTVEKTPGGNSAEGTATPTATPAEAQGIVEKLGSVDGGRVRFILTELQRSGATVILNARLEKVDPSAPKLQVANTFDDGEFQELENGATEPADVFDGVALIDPVGKKKYFVARDETNSCVCSNNLSAAFVSTEAPVELTATLAAPPPGVTKVDLVVPNFGTLHDVALAN